MWFANAAEALAEGRGKAKAAALRRTRDRTCRATRPASGEFSQDRCPARDAAKGDLVRVDRTELIPTDGEVVEGTAYVDEVGHYRRIGASPERAGNRYFFLGDRRHASISDWLVVRVTADPGESFLDRMIHLVEGAKRQKTPNEIALTVLLAILTLIFVIVVAAMAPVASLPACARINVADLIALLVALIPTTIGALLSAIGIAGIDRTVRFNVLAMSGKAVEAAGDVHTLILDKTGTITHRQSPGDRIHCRSPGSSAKALVQAAYLASCFDTTPEGRTIVAWPSS